MTVYADVLVVLNIFINYFLLSGASLILRYRPKRWRMVLGAFCGGLYALVIFLPEIPNALSVLMNFAASALIVIFTFAPNSVRTFLRAFSAFFAVNFVFAGLMLAVWLVFKPRGMVYNNTAVYFDINIMTLILSTVGCYIILTLFSKLLKHRAPSETLYDVELANRGRAVTAKALLDTGHTLSDGFSDMPVIIAEPAVVKKLVAPSLHAFFDGKAMLPICTEGEKIRLIPVGTVGGSGTLKAVVIDRLNIPKQHICVSSVLLAQSQSAFSSGEYSVLVGPQIFNVREGKRKNETHKKTVFMD